MARLIVNPGTPEAWEQDLAPGTYRLGRGDHNDLAIEHPSVSSAHCRLEISETVARLTDLGSVGGTFLNSQLVETAALRPGDKFFLGEVAMQLDLGEAAVVQGDAAPGVAAAARCAQHPVAAGRHYCPRCRAAYCDLCVTHRSERGVPIAYCRRCGTDCIGASTEEPLTASDFLRRLPGAFAYPLRGDGLLLILAGGVFFLLLGWMPIVGLLLSGYLFNYAKTIVATSVQGADVPPDWPDIGNLFEDMVLPYFHMLALVLLTFGPAILLGIFLPENLEFRRTLVFAVGAAGALLAPMAMLALSVFDSVSALNPLPLVMAIARIPLHYTLAALAFGMVLGAYAVCDEVLGAVLPLPLLPGILSGFLNLYLLAVSMRILGLLYRAKKDELGWFGK